MIPVWSVRARKAKAVFYREWNDIDIFIEDTGKSSKKIFRQILSRCFKDKYRVAEVFPLAGRESVIAACQKDQTDGGHPRLYLVDGDLDLILNAGIAPLKRFFSLPVYCIENVLIDQSAIIEVLYEEDPSSEHDDLETAFDFESWLQTLDQPLKELFVDYALCKEASPDIETVAFKVSQLVSSGDGMLDSAKLRSRVQSIETEILKVISSQKYAERKQAIIDTLKARSLFDVRKIVSGKHYLLPLIRMRMRNIAKIRADNESLNIRLAKYCDTSVIGSVCGACESAIQAGSPAVV